MKAMGIVQTERKYGAGGNASAHTASVNARKIEESDELKHNKVRKTLLTPSVLWLNTKPTALLLTQGRQKFIQGDSAGAHGEEDDPEGLGDEDK